MKTIRKAILLSTLVFVLASCSPFAANPIEIPTKMILPTSTSTPKPTNIPTTTLAPTSTSTSAPSPTATLVTVPTSSLNDANVVPLTDECHRIIDGLYTLKAELKLPDHFTGENPFRQAADFNPNKYFKIFKHLKIKPGYTLDYVYFQDELGGKPLVYARKANAAPFHTYEEFLKSYDEEMSGERSYDQLNHVFDYLGQIQIDKTPESYYEFVVLAFLGDQFYLQWHGLYHDSKILCDPSDMHYVYEDLNSFGVEFPQSVKDNLEKIDFRSTVLINSDTVSVRIVAFTKWGGFWENIYVMDKKDPMNLKDVQSNTLLEYDCGISF